MSRRTKMNGWSRRRVMDLAGEGPVHPPVSTPIAVAAAASVPFLSKPHHGEMLGEQLLQTSFESGLLLDGTFGEGLDFQAVVRDPCAAFNRQAEGALRDARFGADHGCKLAL